MKELLAEYGIPGAAVGVLQDGRITEYAFGVADVTTSAPVTTDTIFQCGSMTKTWTALAFMQFADEGKVALDEPVRTFLPGFRVADPEVSARVTPRHLLQHTSGIEEGFGDPGEDDDVYERMVAAIADAPQLFPLGRTHGYSAALGYAILARVMEVLDGKRWDDIMRDRLFAPLGLKSTISSRTGVDLSRAATGHLLRSAEEGPVVTPVDFLPRCYGPGGNVSSTVRDVLTMANLFLDRAAPASIQEMLTSRVPLPDPYTIGSAWGLGLIVADWQGETVYASDGSTIGQNARLRILPDSGMAVVVLTNGGPSDAFHRRAFAEILGEPRIPDLPVPNRALTLDTSRYEGVYGPYEVTARGGELRVTLTHDPMHAEFLGTPAQVTYDLLPISETHFLMPPAGPLEDTQTAAIYDFADGRARYLYTNFRVSPRLQ